MVALEYALSFIGTLVSLTDNSEVRYEGILTRSGYHFQCIALRNVRDYGTEGRRRNGPQVPPSGRVYTCLRFRVSEIKSLERISAPYFPAIPNNNSVITEELNPSHHVANTAPASAQSEICRCPAIVGPSHARTGVFVSDEVLIEKLEELIELLKARIYGPGTASSSNHAQSPGPGN